MSKNNKKESGLELQLGKQILECKNRFGSWTKLVTSIRKINNGHCSRDTLKKIVERKIEKIPIKTLEGLYKIFNDEERKILEPIFKEVLSFTSMFSEYSEIFAFLPTRYSKDLDAMVINRFHFRAIEELSPHLQHINIRSFDVLQRNPEKKIVDKEEWFKKINNDKNIPIIVLGQPYINIASEYALALIFDVEPFNKTKIDTEKQNIPIKLYWPHPEIDRKGLPLSSFHIDWENIISEFPHKEKNITLKNQHLEKIKEKFPKRNTENDELLKHRRCFVIGENLFASHRREEQENNTSITNYGALIIRRFSGTKKQDNHHFICGFLGAYASDYLAISHRIFNSQSPFPAQLPKLDTFDEPHVLIITIKNTVSKRHEFEKEHFNKEWRDITAIEVISSTLWYKKNEKWKHKESTEDHDRNNNFIGELKEDEVKIKTNLY